MAYYRFEGNANDDMRTYDGTASNVTYEYGLNFNQILFGQSQEQTLIHTLYMNQQEVQIKN